MAAYCYAIPTLHLLGAHIAGVTGRSVRFVLAGASLRLGGFPWFN